MAPIGKDTPIAYTLEAFQDKTQLRYLSHLLFDAKNTYDAVKNLCRNRVSKRAEWLGNSYRHEIESGFINDVYIKWIDNRLGFGLFAGKDIEKGEFIGEYAGLVRPCTYFFANVNEYCFRYPLYSIGFWIYTIDAEEYCNETSFINHSSQPNCDAAAAFHNDLLHVCIVANELIGKGEQLTYDYGNKLYK